MRSRISWLAATATSAVEISSVVPLSLLVRVLAEDRAMAVGDGGSAALPRYLRSVQDVGARLVDPADRD